MSAQVPSAANTSTFGAPTYHVRRSGESPSLSRLEREKELEASRSAGRNVDLGFEGFPNVCFGSLADTHMLTRHVRFPIRTRPEETIGSRPLCAKSGTGAQLPGHSRRSCPLRLTKATSTLASAMPAKSGASFLPGRSLHECSPHSLLPHLVMRWRSWHPSGGPVGFPGTPAREVRFAVEGSHAAFKGGCLSKVSSY